MKVCLSPRDERLRRVVSRSGALAFLGLALSSLSACEGDDPVPTDAGARDTGSGDTGMPDAPAPETGTTDTGGRDADATDAMADGSAMDDATMDGAVRCPGRVDPTCRPLPTDYRPGADDMWPSCVSDDGEYHPIMASISTIARVMQYDEIDALLFDPTRDAPPDAFVMARMIYQVSEGLDSRVARRYDPHVPAPEGTVCTTEENVRMYPEYCVGPSKLQPMILRAFNEGIMGMAPRRNAATIEAALLWFLAISTYKESLTCTTTPRDCDSAYAYYTGGAPRDGGRGLARLVRAVHRPSHERAWDGLLAVRCWRNLEGESTVPATMLELRERARTQFDRAVLHGLAMVLRDRLVRLCSATGGEREYLWTFSRTLLDLFDRIVRARNAEVADELRAFSMLDDPSVDAVHAAIGDLDAVFDCP
ncbi:MAG: hypothetical protein NZ898_12040 [Myxococcota bacterium]|nr:hypothetical protein [Myxococcota bacterium]MDW8360925.1 hypothetical protein [Myxococcales bacterium]